MYASVMVASTRVILSGCIAMATAPVCFPIATDTRGSGAMASAMAWEHYTLQMDLCTMESGVKTRHAGMVGGAPCGMANPRKTHSIQEHHRQGVAVYKGIGTYTGEFANNQRCGWGVMQFEDGTRAEGEWAHDTIHGEAVCTHADGSVFVGCYEHGVRTRGTLTKGCSKWQGPFVDDMLHGHGSCVVEGQYEYTGRFAGGLRDGPQGRCVYADGSVYEGGWAGGMRVGHGVLSGVGAGGTWERYEGAWVDDSPHGDGMPCVTHTCMYVLVSHAHDLQHHRHHHLS